MPIYVFKRNLISFEIGVITYDLMSYHSIGILQDNIGYF